MRSLFIIFCSFLLNGYLYAQQSDSSFINRPIRFSWKQTYMPAGLISLGLISNGKSSESIKNELLEERNEHLAGFSTHLDDYLQFSPILITYGLDLFGIKARTDFANRTAILVKSELLMLVSVTFLKKATYILRPDGSSNTSLPSGHTAQAFAAATFLNAEYGRRYKWVPFLSYGIASAVGALRIANNKHYLSDVLIGAGIGIVSTKIVYWTHSYRWGKKKYKIGLLDCFTCPVATNL